MKVQLQDTWATPEFVKHPGVYELPESVARQLIAGGHAVSLEPEKKPTKERASVKAGNETREENHAES